MLPWLLDALIILAPFLTPVPPCPNPESPISGVRWTPSESRNRTRVPSPELGIASWYGPQHQGRPTASGQPFDMFLLTAAHRQLPFGSRVRVTNLRNGLSVVVRINDRGPGIPGRLIDLSWATAQRLGFLRQGLTAVRIEVL